MMLFDQIDGVSRKLIIRLKAPILFTVKADLDRRWVLDVHEPLGEDLSNELEERCYPNYDKTLSQCAMDSKMGTYSENDLKRLAKALQQDEAEAEKRLKSVFPTLDIVAMFPRGLPGQEN